MAMLLLIWLAPAPASADAYAGISIKGGLTGAKYNLRHRFNRYGASGGIAGYLGLPLAGRFSLGGQLEVLYTPRGTQVFFGGVYGGQTRLHYYDVAITARLEARLGQGKLYLLLGGSRNRLVNADDWSALGTHQDITHLFHRTDVALRTGIGIAWPFPRQVLEPFRHGGVFLEANHDRGMTDIDVVGYGIRNRSASLMVGLTFGGGFR
jgi:hypothetical protein